MNINPYQSYKKSGLDWVPEVPDGWSVVPLKHVCSFYTGWTPPTGNSEDYIGENLWANISDLGQAVIFDTAKRLSDEAIARHRITKSPAGSLLFSFKLSIGQVSFAGEDMYTNEAIATFPPNELLDLRYAFYAFPLMIVQNASENIYGAKMLNQQLIRSAMLVVPPLQEQTNIAAFLARETGKIDFLIEEQKRLIALLEEKRQAAISQAVTKGLDPNAPMKDSGVEWLGEMPMHWELCRLRFLCDIETGDADTVDALDDGEFPLFVRSPIVERINRYTHNCEAVLTSGDGAGVGRIYHHYEGKFAAHQRVYIFRNFRRVVGRFFHKYLEANFYKVALEGGAKSTVDSLRRPLIANFWVTVPSIKEQEEIVREVLALETSYLSLVAEVETALRLLQERRSALISAVVTGKIDVRGLVPDRAEAA